MPKRPNTTTVKHTPKMISILKVPNLDAKMLGTTRPGMEEAFRIAICMTLEKTGPENPANTYHVEGDGAVNTMIDSIQLGVEIYGSVRLGLMAFMKR